MSADPSAHALDDIKEKLRRCEFFRRAPSDFISDLARQVDVVKPEAGAQIVGKGEAGDTMFMITKGDVEVVDGNVVLRRLTAGDVFGELSALVQELRTASVRAATDCVLYRLDRNTLYGTLHAHVDAYPSVIEGLCYRGRDMAHYAGAQAVKVELFEQELAIGRQIQSGFLPEKLPQLTGWDLSAHFQSAREVAGDFYDVFQLQDLDRVALLVGDVCGKGVGAALFMTLFRSLLRSALVAPPPTLAPVARDSDQILLQSVVSTNNYIARTHAKSSMFASVFLALVDTNTGELSYVNGGHEPPLLVGGTEGERALDITGPALGLFENAKYAVEKTRMSPGEVMFVYTDGVSEAMDASKHQFGEARIKGVLEQHHDSASAVINSMADAITKFTRFTPQHDDITMLALKRDR